MSNSRAHMISLLTIATLAFTSTGAGAEPLVTGKLVDTTGAPVRGDVSVFTWPRTPGTAMRLVATGRADATGTFSAEIGDPAAVRAATVDTDGWIDFLAVSGTGDLTGQWAFTSRIVDTGATLRSVRSDDALSRGTARTASHGRPPTIRIRVPRPAVFAPPSARRASITGPCTSREPERRPVSRQSRWAIIGELNNAYNDGTTARFSYAQERHAETSFGVAISKDDEATFLISGETAVTNGGSVTFPAIRRRYARKLRTKFEFTKEQIRVTPCSAWETYIRVTDWLGGANDDSKQSGALDVCDRAYIGPLPPGARATRESGSAVRWNRGATAFGVYLTATSGFSRNVSLEYRFGGSAGKEHYLCGPTGREGYTSTGRVFSGAR